MGVILPPEKTIHVFFSDSKFRGGHRFGRRRRRHVDEGEAPARIAFRVAANSIRHSSVHRRLRLAGIGWQTLAPGDARHGRRVMLYAQGILPFLLPLSVLLFEPDGKGRRRMLPFLAVG